MFVVHACLSSENYELVMPSKYPRYTGHGSSACYHSVVMQLLLYAHIRCLEMCGTSDYEVSINKTPSIHSYALLSLHVETLATVHTVGPHCRLCTLATVHPVGPHCRLCTLATVHTVGPHCRLCTLATVHTVGPHYRLCTLATVHTVGPHYRLCTLATVHTVGPHYRLCTLVYAQQVNQSSIYLFKKESVKCK